MDAHGRDLARHRGKKRRSERETARQATAERDALAGRLEGPGSSTDTADQTAGHRRPPPHRPQWLRPHGHH
ncbi:hypothetical protein SVIOM342S_01694 [Streptomyces violaceorubidus]